MVDFKEELRYKDWEAYNGPENLFSTMYDDYFDPQPGCNMLPADLPSSSAIMDLEENLQRPLLRLPIFSPGENNFSDEAGMLGSDLQQQLNFELEQEYNSQIIQDVLQQHNNLHQEMCSSQQQPNNSSATASSWEASFHEMQEITLFQQQQQQQQQNILHIQDQGHHISSFASSNASTSAYPAPELLELLQLPRCSMPSSAISFNSNHPQLSFNPPQPPLLRDMLHTLNSHNYQLNPSRSYFGMDEKEAALQAEAEAGRQFTNSILDLKRDMSLSKGEVRGANHFATERQRREYLNEKYQNLRTLVPNPTKADRASIVGDAIDYIKELVRTVDEMKTLVEQKRSSGIGRSKRHKINHDHVESSSQHESVLQCGQDQKFLTNGSLRSSWLQRTSKDGTQVDVRIVDNEVNIKLIQRKRRSCLLSVSLVLHELHLEILHANGANIGEHYIFMFNTKIYEGSSEYARSIATKLMDAVDRQLTFSIPNF